MTWLRMVLLAMAGLALLDGAVWEAAGIVAFVGCLAWYRLLVA